MTYNLCRTFYYICIRNSEYLSDDVYVHIVYLDRFIGFPLIDELVYHRSCFALYKCLVF